MEGRAASVWVAAVGCWRTPVYTSSHRLLLIFFGFFLVLFLSLTEGRWHSRQRKQYLVPHVSFLCTYTSEKAPACEIED